MAHAASDAINTVLDLALQMLEITVAPIMRVWTLREWPALGSKGPEPPLIGLSDRGGLRQVIVKKG